MGIRCLECGERASTAGNVDWISGSSGPPRTTRLRRPATLSQEASFTVGSVGQTLADSALQLRVPGDCHRFIVSSKARSCLRLRWRPPPHPTPTPVPTLQILGLPYLQEVSALGGFGLSSGHPQAQGQSCGSLFSNLLCS